MIAVKKRLTDDQEAMMQTRVRFPSKTQKFIYNRIIFSGMPIQNNAYVDRLAKMYRLLLPESVTGVSNLTEGLPDGTPDTELPNE